MMAEEDQNDPMNHQFIGPEKLLSLYSESNWGNYCLSYLLTNRDYSGVLGLAWEGKAGEALRHMCTPITAERSDTSKRAATVLVGNTTPSDSRETFERVC